MDDLVIKFKKLRNSPVVKPSIKWRLNSSISESVYIFLVIHDTPPAFPYLE